MNGVIKFFSLVEQYNACLKLFESPMRIQQWNPEELNDRNANFAYTKITKEKANKVGTFGVYGIYEYKVGNDIFNAFVNGEFTCAFFKFSERNGDFLEKNVWQDGLSLGLCRRILFDCYLKKYNRIISDGLHSELGERYWKKLMSQALKEGYKVYVIDGKNNKIFVDDTNSLDKFYGLTMESEKLRFVIER